MSKTFDEFVKEKLRGLKKDTVKDTVIIVEENKDIKVTLNLIDYWMVEYLEEKIAALEKQVEELKKNIPYHQHVTLDGMKPVQVNGWYNVFLGTSEKPNPEYYSEQEVLAEVRKWGEIREEENQMGYNEVNLFFPNLKIPKEK